jgi:hypothetical protein
MYVEKKLVTSFVMYFDVSFQDSPLEIKPSLELGSNIAEIQTFRIQDVKEHKNGLIC